MTVPANQTLSEKFNGKNNQSQQRQARNPGWGGVVMAEPIDLPPLLDVALLMKVIFGYSSVKSLKRFRRASSRFHPQIQTFWYRFDTRQQMYYLGKYALDMLAKKRVNVKSV
jgi:hypothetical protein